MPTYRLTIEYEGTRYRGWQEQTNARTVAGELRRAITDLVPIADFGGAGRTDGGVHAAAQTAHLRLARSVSPASFRREVNQRLPPDIHVIALDAAPDRFHARHAATARSYLYQIALRRTALAKRFVWWVREPLDLARMNETVTIFRGRHDFVRFCERPAEQASTVVVVDQVELARCDGLLLVRIVASHFLWRMVRRVVGAMVRVGAGAIPPDGLRALLGEGPSPPGMPGAIGSPAEWTAPASGLFLERVLYPGDPPLGPLRPIVPVGGDDDVP